MNRPNIIPRVMSILVVWLIAMHVQISENLNYLNLLPSIDDVDPRISYWFDKVALNITSRSAIVTLNLKFPLKVPALLLDSSRKLPNIERITTKDYILYFFVNAVNVTNISDLLTNFEQYIGVLESSRFLLYVSEKPSKETKEFLRKHRMYWTFFVDELLQLRDNTWKILPLESLTREQVNITRSLRICYNKIIPYTYMDGNKKGYEQKILDIAGEYAKLDISYKMLETNCSDKGKYVGPLALFYNYSCDGSQGHGPCLSRAVEDFAYSTSYIEDGSLLVAPDLLCPRQVGLILINPIITAFIAVITVCLYIFGVLLASPNFTFEFKISHIFNTIERASKVKTIKFLIIIPLLLTSIVISGFLQGQLYDSLVNKIDNCNIKQVEDILERRLHVGVESFIYEDVIASTFKGVNTTWLAKFFSKDTNIKKLDPKKCHILREGVFRYWFPKHYVGNDGQTVFRYVQMIKKVPFSVLLRKGYPFRADVNKAIMLAHQSGLYKVIKEQIFGDVRMQRVIDHSRRLSNYTPVKYMEISWLFLSYIGNMCVCLLVFSLEISIR